LAFHSSMTMRMARWSSWPLLPNWPLASFVTYAFSLPQPSRVSGLPEWTRSTRYDVVGRAAGPITEPQRRQMMQAVLVNRFGLRTHVEKREQPVYVMLALHADKRTGPGLTPRPDCESSRCSEGGTGRPDGLSVRATTLTRLADGMLSNVLRQVVVDETGIPGIFDATASWRPESAAADPSDVRPSIFTALEEQWGVKLQPARRPVDVLVVDAIARPEPD